MELLEDLNQRVQVFDQVKLLQNIESTLDLYLKYLTQLKEFREENGYVGDTEKELIECCISTLGKKNPTQSEFNNILRLYVKYYHEYYNWLYKNMGVGDAVIEKLMYLFRMVDKILNSITPRKYQQVLILLLNMHVANTLLQGYLSNNVEVEDDIDDLISFIGKRIRPGFRQKVEEWQKA